MRSTTDSVTDVSSGGMGNPALTKTRQVWDEMSPEQQREAEHQMLVLKLHREAHRIERTSVFRIHGVLDAPVCACGADKGQVHKPECLVPLLREAAGALDAGWNQTKAAARAARALAVDQSGSDQRPPAPLRAFEVRISIGANGWDGVLEALDQIVGKSGEPVLNGCSGGWNGSWSITTALRDVTPEQYRNELDAWRQAKQFADAVPFPERRIEYEVPEHPWASEEGPLHPAWRVVESHEEAAKRIERNRV